MKAGCRKSAWPPLQRDVCLMGVFPSTKIPTEVSRKEKRSETRGSWGRCRRWADMSAGEPLTSPGPRRQHEPGLVQTHCRDRTGLLFSFAFNLPKWKLRLLSSYTSPCASGMLSPAHLLSPVGKFTHKSIRFACIVCGNLQFHPLCKR